MKCTAAQVKYIMNNLPLSVQDGLTIEDDKILSEEMMELTIPQASKVIGLMKSLPSHRGDRETISKIIQEYMSLLNDYGISI